MTNTYSLNGPTSWFGSVTRILFLGCAAVAGLFMLAVSAAFAFFVVAGIAIVGLLAFVFFWGRAKILGKPFGPRAQFEAQAKKMQAEFGAPFADKQASEGPIIDAKHTPDGWSVDD
ncbi:hypothetical protein DES40_1060 [Litorimonas taeanensis]|uniref:Uncharacterized protein n=1 Tax=Litorimonas taeanensis TaxID=568099 RepID=A0A420WL08_9PROT|nr:hypothetical protein [Litorimonas taeanensis]RKQ71731.1 hypothetical protein DES40_1060 [Litorimonas taeanensis]